MPMPSPLNDKVVVQRVNYRKTEHEYKVSVEAEFYTDLSSQFWESDEWDARPYPFKPSLRERTFAEALRHQPPSAVAPHIDLDEEVAQEMVANWLTEPDSIGTGIASLSSTLQRLSLSRVDGEYLLDSVNRAVEDGRRLAHEKTLIEQQLKQLFKQSGNLDEAIAYWLRTIGRLVRAVECRACATNGERNAAA
jgi:hypothetical protein